MTEFIVYEDSPLAEYLQSIDKAETTDAFSVSLPRSEETAFEEKFKYLIVTSPLLNETLSIHHNRHQQQQQPTFQTSATSTSTKLGLATNLITTLAVLLGAERYMMQPKIPVITLFFSTSASIFFIYRHRRRSFIRQLYQIALTRMGAFTNHCDTFDTKVHRCLITIQEIELVSRGYRLSTPLSPISRIEQNSKSRKCVQLRNRLASVLRRAFIIYEEGIIDLMDVIHKKNLNTLYEMYNVHSIASLSAMGDDISDEGYSLEQLKKLAQIMHSKRRECMVHFLALGVMTEDHDSVHYNYSEGWGIINQVLGKLVDETEKFTLDIVEALDAEFYKPMHGFDKNNDTSKIEDARLKKFVHRLSSLEQQLRTMEAKIYLCSEDVRQLNSAESSTEVKDKLLNEYMSVQKGFENMIQEWELGKTVLESFLEPSSSSTTITEQQEKLVEQQDQHEHQDETEGKGMILDSEDVADILNLPLASKASVFEAIAGVVEKNGREKSKMTRKERIEEMRMKRTKQSEDKLNRMDSQTMVHELKNVLFKRVNDLDLEQDTPPSF
ncbi:Mysoin-binding motif of peroxisomes-domain-containing protein [Helicostylum pulchrum]|nr:Mysoin-binding motif of peroxisomes-domain-containing protein [Helicostylum pulchrum]